MDQKTFTDMMEQQRQLYTKLQQSIAPHSEWMAKLAQQMPTVDPAVLEKLNQSKAAIEAAMTEHVKNLQAYEEFFEAANSANAGYRDNGAGFAAKGHQGRFRSLARLDKSIRASSRHADEGVRRRDGECSEGLVVSQGFD